MIATPALLSCRTEVNCGAEIITTLPTVSKARYTQLASDLSANIGSKSLWFILSLIQNSR